MLDQIKAINKTIQSSSLVLKTMMESGAFDNPNDAFVVLRACLKTVRDRLEHGEAVHLGGQLPALLRGFYYEAWDFKRQNRIRTKEAFLAEVKRMLNGHDAINLEDVVPHAMKVILDIIDQGEAVQILHGIPKEIRDLCP
jgi:uncharacterized protein (DUF2267 family)